VTCDKLERKKADVVGLLAIQGTFSDRPALRSLHASRAFRLGSRSSQRTPVARSAINRIARSSRKE